MKRSRKYDQRRYYFRKEVGREPDERECELLREYSTAEVIAYYKIKAKLERGLN